MDATSRIIAEVVSQCKRKGTLISKDLASFVARTILAGNAMRLDFDTVLDATQVAELIHQSIHRITTRDAPQLETIRLQIELPSAKEEHAQQQEQIRKIHEAKAEKLVTAILPKKVEAEAFGDIVFFILHKTKQLENNNEVVEKETITALESVIPRNFIASFISQAQSEKREQLEELWKIVWGIRLFNRETGVGGVGIESLPTKVTDLYQELTNTVQQQLRDTRQVIDNYQSFLEHKASQSHTAFLDKQIERLYQEMTFYIQFVEFLEAIKRDVARLRESSADIGLLYASMIEEVSKLVSDSVSVPKSQIYPRFMHLSDLWQKLEAVFLELQIAERSCKKLITSRDQFNITLTPSGVEAARKAMATRNPPPVPQLIGQSMGFENPLDVNDLLSPMNRRENEPFQSATKSDKQTGTYYPDWSNLTAAPEFNGYCCTSLCNFPIQYLYRGVKEAGFVNYNSKPYVFASRAAAQAFAEDPKLYLDRAMDIASQSPELILLLKLGYKLSNSILQLAPGYESANQTIELQNTIEKKRSSSTMVDSELQTDTHVVESYKDPNYQWNEWKLRKQAFVLADLRNKRTHSTQTDSSHFRRDSDTQVYLPKEKTTQTAKDAATNPPKNVRYVQGLRDRQAKQLSVVSVKLEL